MTSAGSIKRHPTGVAVAILLGCAALTVGGCGNDGDTQSAGSGRPGLLLVVDAPTGAISEPHGGTAQITLEHPNPRVVAFSDRPRRRATTATLPDVVAAWNRSLFRTSPPNAALQVQGAENSDVVAVQLSRPRLRTDGNLVFGARILMGNQLDVPLRDGFASRADRRLVGKVTHPTLFIDSGCGLYLGICGLHG